MFKEIVKKIGSMFIDTFILITNNHGNLDIVYENLDEYSCFSRTSLPITSCSAFCWQIRF